MHALKHPPPANDLPQPRTFEAIVLEFGFASTRALRDWCRRRKIAYRRDGRYRWVDRGEVLAAIARGAVYAAPETAAPPSVAAWVTATVGDGGTRGT